MPDQTPEMLHVNRATLEALFEAFTLADEAGLLGSCRHVSPPGPCKWCSAGEDVQLALMEHDHLCPQCGTSDLIPSTEFEGQETCVHCGYLTNWVVG